MPDWAKLRQQIGPLRYQASSSDCVPTTIINGLSVLLEGRLHPKLLRLIWALSGDQDGESGTGWVCSEALSHMIDTWFRRAHQDWNVQGPMPFTSRIVEGSVKLDGSTLLRRCLAGGGVACVTTGKNADHYTLLLALEDDHYLGFDSWWNPKKNSKSLQEFDSYHGMVNTRWTSAELEKELLDGGWVHLLGRTRSG